MNEHAKERRLPDIKQATARLYDYRGNRRLFRFGRLFSNITHFQR